MQNPIIKEYKGVHSIVSRHSKSDEPQVLKVLPIVEGKPFPTLYWLVCPILKRELSKIESTGFVKEFEKVILTENPDLLTSLKNDHERYRDQRINLLKSEFPEEEAKMSEGFKKQIFETGIGGIRDFATIKCLHLQYAFHLASGPTTVGSYLDEHFQMKKFI